MLGVRDCWFVVCGWLLFCVAFACCLLLLFPETPSVSFHSFSCVGMDNRYKWIDDRLSSERVRHRKKKMFRDLVFDLKVGTFLSFCLYFAELDVGISLGLDL